MEINLSLISEDFFNLNISPQNKEIINNLGKLNEENEKIEKIFIDEIKNNNIILKNNYDPNFFDIIIKKHNLNDKIEIGSNKDYDYNIEIKAKDKLKEEIEKKINLCVEKEKILLNKENELKKLSESINFDEKLLEKKLLCLIEKNNEKFEAIYEQIIKNILDYENFIKEAKGIQERLIKYRNCLILALCFRIYLSKVFSPIEYIIDKKIIFLNNEKLFRILNKLYLKVIRIIIDEIYDNIFGKLADKEIFKNHKEEYEQKINYYREVSYLFPILKFFESSQEKDIYEIKNDLDLDFSENYYDKILRINSQIPKRNGLNITLEYFKEHTNIDESYAMSLKRILLIGQKYNILFPTFKNSSFLYD